MTTEPPGTGVAAGVVVSPDTVSQVWVARLRRQGAERDAALAELHGLLLRTARFEIGRRRAAFSHLCGADLDDLAWQSADDALMSMPAMRAHLTGCKACREDHDTLLTILQTGAPVIVEDRGCWDTHDPPH